MKSLANVNSLTLTVNRKRKILHLKMTKSSVTFKVKGKTKFRLSFYLISAWHIRVTILMYSFCTSGKWPDIQCTTCFILNILISLTLIFSYFHFKTRFDDDVIDEDCEGNENDNDRINIASLSLVKMKSLANVNSLTLTLLHQPTDSTVPL